MPSSLIPRQGFGDILSRIIPERLQGLENDHPIYIAGRTYALSLSLSLVPALVPLLTDGRFGRKQRSRLLRILKKELSISGFAFTMTVAAGGGAVLEHCWRRVSSEESTIPASKNNTHNIPLMLYMLLKHMKPLYRTFTCNTITALLGIMLMHSRPRPSNARRAAIPLTIAISPSDGKASTTINLTLLLLVRALDSFAQRLFYDHAKKSGDLDQSGKNKATPEDEKRLIRKRVAVLSDKLDALIFWAASARIMWYFFYEPERLPRSYVKWIGALANVDQRLLLALRKLRSGTWGYGQAQSHSLLSTMAEDLGYPPSWGDSLQLPEYGGKGADEIWKTLGVKGRAGVGGLPCEVVHGGVGSSIISGGVGESCTANAMVRGGMGFIEALALYTPVHFLPVLLTRPRELFSSLALKRLVFALLRSSLFLSVFISSIWTAVCFTRTWGLARLFPRISHNFYDGPFGCIMAGCLVCGGSIWIEQGRRRGEIALYVLPRALRTLMDQSYLRSGSRNLLLLERSAFVLSLASILTASRHYPDSLRGLSRWTAMSIMKGKLRA